MKDKAFEFFDSMPSGQIIAIKEIAKKDPEAFKQYIKDYIDKGGLITVSPDWRKFRKDNNPKDFKVFDYKIK
jgi:zona occludens toxin (predicted ATPase)